MATDFKIWDLDQLKVVVAGIPVTGGYGDGDVLTVEYTEPGFTTIIGADGGVTRSKTYNGHATLTLSLMNTSLVNALLSSLYNLDRAAPNGAGVGPLSIVDLNGATLYEAPKSWIATMPNRTFARGGQVLEWTIECAGLKSFESGTAF